MAGANEIDEELVERARRGDIAAYGRLVAATERFVRWIIAREVADAGLRDDVVQETYLRAFRKLPGLAESHAFSSWLGRVAVTTARNELRRHRRVFVDESALDWLAAPLPDESGDDLARTELGRALVGLPPEERRLMERYYLGRWTAKRLAQEEGVSPAAVRKRLQRLRDRLRRDIVMAHTTEAERSLPDRIVALLSRPILANLPENPVGAVWETIRGTLAGMEVIELPEVLEIAEIEEVFGDTAANRSGVHRVGEGRILRFDQTMPMLLAARGRPVGTGLAAVGKVYRDVSEDSSHLQAFHQAELFWTTDRGGLWSPMERVEAMLDVVLPGIPVRAQQADYPLYADRGYEVAVRDGERWVEIAGWARFAPRIVRALGHDSDATTAFGIGLGLERIACLTYGIEDVRHVSESRVDE